MAYIRNNIDTLTKVVQLMKDHKENPINIDSYLTTVRANLDRHFSTKTRMNFELAACGIRTSGNKLMILGKEETFEIHCDNISEIQIKEDKEIFIEESFKSFFRSTFIKLLS